MSGNISQPEMKALFMKSGGVCAFPGCPRELLEPGKAGEETAITGEMAHIVGEKRQGPRGNFPLDYEDRNKESNLVLLCPTHHKIVDTQLRTYTVAVMRKMKADHEAAVRFSNAPQPANNLPELVKDKNIHSTILPVTHLPELVYSAPCKFDEKEMERVKQAVNYPANYQTLCPFIIRENRLHCFYDLQEANNPFSDVIDTSQEKPTWKRAADMWKEAEGKRRFINLLNRSLYKYTSRIGIRYDPEHYRFYFPVDKFGQERTVRYRSMNKEHQERNVAWQPVTRSTGIAKDFWWHRAARLQFHQFDSFQWGMSIRPERHLTLDSEQPLPADEVGPKVTKLKSKMYNEGYLSEVVFWRDYLSQSQPRIILNFGSQTAVINVEMLKFNIEWPGIPGDFKAFKNETYRDDLFSFSEYTEALSGEEVAWDEFDEGAEDDEEEY